jgi:hypothetical protein
MSDLVVRTALEVAAEHNKPCMHGPPHPFLSGRKTEALLTSNPCNAISHFNSSLNYTSLGDVNTT